ncbi:MAG: tRNA 2-thiocytidine biosynthesis TtcA family protein [Archaeoglobaceae archaeon]
MRCRCGGEAVTYLRYLRRPLCGSCFTRYYLSSVERAIKKYGILRRSEKVLAAVSGGKDSAAMSFALKKLGYDFEMLFIDLGIPEYSKACQRAVERLSERIDVNLNVVELKDYGFTIARVSAKTCSACGVAKRYIMNTFARQRFDVIATGHTAEDLTSFFLKNVAGGMHEWAEKLKPRNEPFDAKIVARAKPIFAMSERENLVLTIVNDVPFEAAECPYAPEPEWKEIVYEIERRKPGFAKNFVRGLASEAKGFGEVRYCRMCGEVASGELCAFCKLRLRLTSGRS